MDNSQGYLFIALGRYYIDQVVNTVKSIRIQGDNRPCSIISLNDDVEYCSDMRIFDQVIRFKTDPQVFAQCRTPFEKFGLYPKITMNHYPVYQETMVVDCDMLCIYDTAPLWKFASSYRHDIILKAAVGEML